MKFLVSTTIALMSIVSYGQETFLKSYNIKKQKKINNNYFLAKLLTKNSKVDKYDDNFHLKEVDFNLLQLADTPSKKRKLLKNAAPSELNDFKGVLKFEENIVYVTEVRRKRKSTIEPSKGVFAKNRETKKNEMLYFYNLKNGQTLRLGYTSFALNTLTIPIKYRFKGRTKVVRKDVTASVSGVLHGGITWGWTSFTHRQGTVNESNDWNLTLGPVLGVSVVNLNKTNTFGNVFVDSETANKGLVSTGLGFTFTFNKFGGGLFYGWDYAIGEFSDNWFYNKRPWLGLGVGFSLFK
jgi:hypothetical protein